MSQQKVLIVDDEQSLREALGEALRDAGFEVFLAKNGEEGLAVALKEHPDLTLLDVMMPKMNGHKTLYELRKDAWGKDAQVLMLTALDDAGTITQDVELKSNDYIIKSNTSLESIVKKVRQHIAGYHD